MQATTTRPQTRARPPRPSFKGIGCAVRYLTNYGRQALLPYVFLIIATLSQLAVPNLVGNVIDAVTSGYIANQVLDALANIPAAFVSQALPKILALTGLDTSLTVDQLRVQLEADINNAPRLLINALIFIIIFAALRGIFSFLQSYLGENNYQAVAYYIRNDLYE